MGISFLFGAGTDSVYGICKGASFAEPLLLGKYAEERKKMLGDSVGAYRLLYPQSKKIYLQTIISNQDEAREIFDRTFVDKCVEYYNKDYAEENSKDIRAEFDDYFKNWYKMITEKRFVHKYCDQRVYDFFLNKAVFFDSLDEKMNDLRNNPLHTNGKRMINAYATIFIMMINQLYDIPVGYSWTYPDLFLTLRNSTLGKVKFDIQSYYKILRELLDVYALKKDVYFTTTNYTEIAERVLDKEITYLHGNLNWFEDYEHLRVYDCKKEDDYQQALNHTERMIPFILIPSGIKPIICTRQIESFYNFVNNLNCSDILCIIGYKFNSEDNHINAIIAEWLQKKNKKLVYFNYKGDVAFRKLKWLDDIFDGKLIDELDGMHGDSTTVEKFMKSDKKILNIIIGEKRPEDDFDIFKETVKQLIES